MRGPLGLCLRSPWTPFLPAFLPAALGAPPAALRTLRPAAGASPRPAQIRGLRARRKRDIPAPTRTNLLAADEVAEERTEDAAEAAGPVGMGRHPLAERDRFAAPPPEGDYDSPPPSQWDTRDSLPPPPNDPRGEPRPLDPDLADEALEVLRLVFRFASGRLFDTGRDMPTLRHRLQRAWKAYLYLGPQNLTHDELLRVAFMFAKPGLVARSNLREFLTRGLMEEEEAREWTKDIEDAAKRLERIVSHAAVLKIQISPEILTFYFTVKLDELTTYRAVQRMLTVFDLLDMPPAPSNIGTLLSGIAGAGNYTGFLHALHGAASRYPDISTNLPLVRTFLGAVRNVARRACEDLEGYHVGPPLARGYSFAADLVVPVDPANRKDGRVSRDSPFAKIPSGPDLHVGRAADPVAALRRMAAHLAPADFLDLCRPDVPPGSVKPGNKVVALLGHALNLHAAGSAELDARVLTAVVEALVAWQQPATAVAAYDLLVGEPYGIQPEETAFIAMLEDCTKRDDEKLGNGVVARWRRDAQGRETRRPLYNALIAFYARTGRPELAREAYGELRAAGHEPNSVTLMALLDAVPPEPQGFAPFRALFDELGTAGVEISTQHWTKALSIMVKRGDRDGMAELLVAIPELDRTAIGVLATDAAERADVEDFKAALRLAPGPEELSHYPTWVAAIRCFRNAMIYVPELREAVVAVAAAVLDEEPLRAEDLPEQLQDVALVGVRPPTSDVAGVFRSALLATVADVLRKVGGVESDLLREKARQCLLRRGLDVPADNVQELCNALLGRTGTGSVVGGPVAKGRPLPS